MQDLQISQPVNQRGIEIFTTAPEVRLEEGGPVSFGEIIIRNCEIGHVQPGAGAPIEGIHITGGGAEQDMETDILIEDVYIHDLQGVPIRIIDGTFGTITFRRVRIEQIPTPAVQVAFASSGSAQRIEIEDSPGLVVRLIGRPGSVGEVATTGSPDAKVVDELSPNPPPAADGVAAGAPPKPDEPLKLSASPATATAAVSSPKAADTRPAPPRPQPPVPPKPDKPMEFTAVAAGRNAVHLTVANVPPDVSHITFGLFDRFDYRIGLPVVLTEAPWETTIKVGKTGVYTARITITRSGGDSDPPLEKRIELR